MSKQATLSEAAYQRVLENKLQDDSISDVIIRFVPKPIKTFGDLEEHLEHNGPIIDKAALLRIKERKQKANHAD